MFTVTKEQADKIMWEGGYCDHAQYVCTYTDDEDCVQYVVLDWDDHPMRAHERYELHYNVQVVWTNPEALPHPTKRPRPKTELERRSVPPNFYSAIGLNDDKFRQVVYLLSKALPAALRKHNAQVIAVQGTSGLCVAFALRMISSIPIIMIRKERTGHHGSPIESLTGEGLSFLRYIFLDDFTSSGSTLEAVRDALPEQHMVAAILYKDASYRKCNSLDDFISTEVNSPLIHLPYTRYS